MRVVEGGEWNVLSNGRLQPLSDIDQTVSSETPPGDKHMGVSDRLQARFTQLQTTPSDSHWRQRPPPGAASSLCRCHATDKTSVRTNDQYNKQNINPGALEGLNGLVSWLMSWLTDDRSVKHFQTKMSNAVRLWSLQSARVSFWLFSKSKIIQVDTPEKLHSKGKTPTVILQVSYSINIFHNKCRRVSLESFVWQNVCSAPHFVFVDEVKRETFVNVSVFSFLFVFVFHDTSQFFSISGLVHYW